MSDHAKWERGFWYFIWHFIRPQRVGVALLVGAMLLRMVDLSFRSYMVKVILDRVATHCPAVGLIFPVMLYLASCIFLSGLYRIYDFVKFSTIPLIHRAIIDTMTEHIEGHSYAFFQQHNSGALAGQVQSLALGVREIIRVLIEQFFSNVLTLVIGAFSLAMIAPALSLIMVVWSIFVLAMTYSFTRTIHTYSQKLSTIQNETMGTVVDSFSNIIAVKLFSSGSRKTARLDKQLDKQVETEQHLGWIALKIQILQGCAAACLIAGLLVYLVYARSSDLLSVGDFAFILSTTISFTESTASLSENFVIFSQNSGICKRALQLGYRWQEVADAPSAKELYIKSGCINFDHVTVTLRNNPPLFNKLTFSIPARQKVGIVGFSDEEKDIFIHVLMRLLSTHEGSILIDGQDIRTVTLDSLHRNISFIPEDPVLFHRSITDNIAYGFSKASVDEIVRAAQMAHAHDFIVQLPQGYDTIVGKEGVSLSKGERQCILLAQAFLKNAPILIVDEAKTFVSPIESAMQESLAILMADKTVIIIAHRLSTIKHLKRIIVFDKGRIVQDGQHVALKKISGAYAELLRTRMII